MILNIQQYLPIIFISIIALPLPLLILYYPLHWIYENLMNRRYYNIVKKHYKDISDITEEQLKGVFPDMKPEQLNEIAEFLEMKKPYSNN